MLLLFNGACSFCASLAENICNSASTKLEILPLQSDRANNLLKEIYPNGAEFTFYFIYEETTPKKSYKGLVASIQLFKIVPLTKFLLFVGMYLNYWWKRKKGSIDKVGVSHKEIDLGRRNFVKSFALLPLFFLLTKFPTTSGFNSMDHSKVKMTLPETIREKIGMAINENIKNGKTFPMEVTIDDPDCISASCQCTNPTSYCCYCNIISYPVGVCVAACQSGCGRFNVFTCCGISSGCSSDSECYTCFCDGGCAGFGCCPAY